MPRQSARLLPKGPASLHSFGVPEHMLTEYSGPLHGGARLVELWWDPVKDPLHHAAPLLRWYSERELRCAALPIGATFYDGGRADWVASTLASESAHLPGEYGLFAAQLFVGDELVGSMQDGPQVSDGGCGKKWVVDYMAGCTRGEKSYYYTIIRPGGFTLHDGAGCRPAGPRNANDARGTRWACNSELLVDGLFRCLDGKRIERLRPDMSVTHRRQCEAVWEYGEPFWS